MRGNGNGVDDLKARLAELMPLSPWLYPEDQTADIPARLLAAEITREKIYLRLHDELPYATMVVTESWKDHKDGAVRIERDRFRIRQQGHVDRRVLLNLNKRSDLGLIPNLTSVKIDKLGQLYIAPQFHVRRYA